MVDEKQDPEAVVDEASVDVGEDKPRGEKRSRAKAPAVDRPFPRKTLEEALRVPTAVRTHNGGKPYAPSEIAKVVGVGLGGGSFFT